MDYRILERIFHILPRYICHIFSWVKIEKSVLKVGGFTDGTCISNAYGGIYKDLFNSYC